MTNTDQEKICSERADVLAREQFQTIWAGTDRVFAALMAFQWVSAIVIAVVISPRTWIGESSSVHLHVWGAVLLGGVLSGFPIFLALKFPGTKLTRHTIAIAQMLWSALLIHLSGGRIETHFHVFGSLAFVAFYRDWRVLLTATIVVAVDHFLRGVFWPLSVFGVMVESPFRWIEHAGWVVFEDVILVLSCQRGVREIYEISKRQAMLELTNERIEVEVDERTCELRTAIDTLAGEIKERESAQERETRLGRIIEQSVNEIYIFNRETLQFKEVNQGALNNLGYSLEEMRELTPLDIKPEFNAESFAELCKPLVDGNEDIAKFEALHRRKDGTNYPVEVHLQFAEWDSETVFVAMILDITERQKLQIERDGIQAQLVDASRQAGMAEIATGILHNVGNVLNSVNVSANLISNQLSSSKVSHLSKVADLFDEHKDNLGEFMTSDEKGRRLPEYINQLAGVLVNERDKVGDEFQAIKSNIDHIKEIVQVQQAYARRSGTEEMLLASDLVEMAIKINDAALTRHEIEIVREFEDIAPIFVDKHSALQILINLIANAKHAIDEHNCTERKICVSIKILDEHVNIDVLDSGVGISSENLTQIFGHGFTTRNDGHGFGLHSSANAAGEMGGSLTASSEGLGCGAVFTLRLPLHQASCTVELAGQAT